MFPGSSLNIGNGNLVSSSARDIGRNLKHAGMPRNAIVVNLPPLEIGIISKNEILYHHFIFFNNSDYSVDVNSNLK
jgi:hypothetical protein